MLSDFGNFVFHPPLALVRPNVLLEPVRIVHHYGPAPLPRDTRSTCPSADSRIVPPAHAVPTAGAQNRPRAAGTPCSRPSYPANSLAGSRVVAASARSVRRPQAPRQMALWYHASARLGWMVSTWSHACSASAYLPSRPRSLHLVSPTVTGYQGAARSMPSATARLMASSPSASRPSCPSAAPLLAHADAASGSRTRARSLAVRASSARSMLTRALALRAQADACCGSRGRARSLAAKASSERPSPFSASPRRAQAAAAGGVRRA